MSRYLHIIVVVLIGYVFSQINVLDQIRNNHQIMNSDSQKSLSRAKAHDRAGQTNEAKLIYDELFNAHPDNQYIYSAFKSFLIKQKNWDELIEISKIYSDAVEPSPYGKLNLAESFLLANRDNEAYKIFDKLFIKHSDDKKKIKRFLSKLVSNNKIEYVSDIVSELRSNKDNPDFFSKELGMYYHNKMEFSKSLNEYILHLSYNPNDIKYVRMKLMSFPVDDDIKMEISSLLKDKKSKIANRILAEYEFKWENYNNAYSLMISNFFKEQELYEFGVNMLEVNQLIYAEKIFKILANSDNKNNAESSIYQLACLYEKQIYSNALELPISDNIVKNSFFELDGFTSKKYKDINRNILESIMHYDSIAQKP